MYLPIVSLNRSQNVRIGSGLPDQLDRTSEIAQPNARVFHAFHANLKTGKDRRDLQRHSAIGAYEVVGPVSAKWSDLYASTSTIVTSGTGLTVNTAAFTIASRLFTDQSALSVAATTGVLAVPSLTTGDVIYLIKVDEYGNLTAIPGASSVGAPTYEVDTLAITGTPTGGTVTLSFTYNGFNYTTAAITYNATAAAVASAVLAATPAGAGPSLPATSITGSGGALPGAAVVLTASGQLEGPITNQSVTSALTGGTAPAATFVQTTAGVGATPPPFDGNSLPIAFVQVPQNATSISSSNITNIALTS